MNFLISQLFKKFIFRTQEQNVSSKIPKNKENRDAETSVDDDDFEDLSGADEDEREEWSPDEDEVADLSSDEDDSKDMKLRKLINRLIMVMLKQNFSIFPRRFSFC